MRAIIVLALCALTTGAAAEDYVGRVLTSCSPLHGRGGHDQCVSDAGEQICAGLQSPADRLACAQDFERYFSARVQTLREKRQAAHENTRRLIEQVQRPAQ